MNNISSTLGSSTQLTPSIQSLVEASRVEGNENFADTLAAIKAHSNEALNSNALSATDPAASTVEGAESVTNELEQIGRDFESIFFSLMLKEMRSSISGEEGGGLFAGEGSDTYGGMFDMFIGQHLADNAELGIGSQIESYLKNKHTNDVIANTSETDSANPKPNTSDKLK